MTIIKWEIHKAIQMYNINSILRKTFYNLKLQTFFFFKTSNNEKKEHNYNMN